MKHRLVQISRFEPLCNRVQVRDLNQQQNLTLVLEGQRNRGGENMESRRIKQIKGMVLFFVLTLLMPGGQTAEAAEFPSRPVEVILNMGPGGFIDLAVRVMGNELSHALGVPAILTNKAGGAGAVGAEYVARAKPDGYTILATPNANFSYLPIMTPGLHYKLSDFDPLARYTSSPNVIVVRKDSPYKNLADIIADAKKNPGKVTCALASMGTGMQYSLELIKTMAGVDIAHLPYKSGGEVNISLMGGHVDFASTGFSPALSLLKSGDLRALAITTGRGKIKDFPNVPTMEELGYPAATLPILWTGYFLPKGTPKPMVNKLTAIFEKAMKNPTVEKNLEVVGQFLSYQDGAALAKSMPEEYKVLEGIARKAKLIK